MDINLCDDPEVVLMKYIGCFFVDLAIDAKYNEME